MIPASRGRVIFTGGHDPIASIVWDYLKRRRKIIGERPPGASGAG